MLGEIVQMLGVLFWVAILTGAEGHDELLADFDVPEDAVVFLSAQSLCDPPPRTMKAAFALRCGSIQSTRECMGISPVEPMFMGR